MSELPKPEGETLFDLFDRPSLETPDLLADRLGEHGLLDKRAEVVSDIEEAQVEIEKLRTHLSTLRADESVLNQALIIARDRGLE